MGQNPRKGFSHTWDDVQAEVCDVITTGMVALRRLTPDADEVFARHLAGIVERDLDESGQPAPEAAPPPFTGPPVIRNGASGIVVRDGHVLFVRGDRPRPDTYWLPGGGQQPGGTLAACAEREVP